MFLLLLLYVAESARYAALSPRLHRGWGGNSRIGLGENIVNSVVFLLSLVRGTIHVSICFHAIYTHVSIEGVLHVCWWTGAVAMFNGAYNDERTRHKHSKTLIVFHQDHG